MTRRHLGLLGLWIVLGAPQAAALGEQGVAYKSDGFVLQLQVCLPSAAEPPEKWAFQFITPEKDSSNYLNPFAGETQDHKKIFAGSALIYNGNRRFITLGHSKDSLLVYPVSLPKRIRPVGWSSWQSPAYVQGGPYAWLAVMHGIKEKQSEPPQEAPRVRFRVLPEALSDDLRMGRATEPVEPVPPCR